MAEIGSQRELEDRIPKERDEIFSRGPIGGKLENARGVIPESEIGGGRLSLSMPTFSLPGCLYLLERTGILLNAFECMNSS